MMRKHLPVIALTMGLLSACAAPPYRPMSAEKSARVHFVNFEKPVICIAGRGFSLTPDANGDASVPAGRPVHLLGGYWRNNGHCFPAVKFLPQAGQTYELMTDVRAERCIVNVMRRDASAQYGLRTEASVPATSLCPY